MNTTRVLLVDDHPVVLAGITALLAAEADIAIVGQAETYASALALLTEVRADVAIVDLSMPGLGGFDLIRQMAKGCPHLRLLVLTVHENSAYVRQSLGAGAHGYLLKRSAADELPRAVRSVTAGGIYLDPQIAAHVLFKPSTVPSSPPADDSLSPREGAVLRLVAQGYSNKEIGGRLDVSVKTVETYRARGAEKLGLRTRAQITRHGAARGWLDDPGEPAAGGAPHVG